MNRRNLLRAASGLAASPLLRRAGAAPEDDRPIVMTVLGPIDPDELGVTLPHEHVLVDFAGAEVASPDRYDSAEVFEVALPHLRQLRELGCRTLCECTPDHLGRDPALLARLSRATGLHLLTNTGYYDANGGKHLPEHARRESAEQLADRWSREWERGIDDTGIRPGFIKIGVDAGPLPETSRNLVRAAALAHRRTGLTIASHTGDGVAAMEQLDLIEAEGVDPSAFIWVHAQNEPDGTQHARAAERGAWVEFDGVTQEAIDRHVELVRSMAEAGLLGRVLLSHDAGWYHVGEPRGGRFRPYDTLFARLVPALDAAGIPNADRERILIDNPAEAFEIRVRLAD